MTGIYRPQTIDFDWWKIIRGKGLSASFKALPVDLASSRKHQEQDKVTELSFFYWLDKAGAERLERELSD